MILCRTAFMCHTVIIDAFQTSPYRWIMVLATSRKNILAPSNKNCLHWLSFGTHIYRSWSLRVIIFH